MAAARTDASITVGADTAPLEKAFTDARAIVKDKLTGLGSDATTALNGVAATIAAAFAFKELKDFVNGVAEARAHLQELSETTGASVASLSEIQGVAKVVGTSMDDVSDAVIKLTKGLSTGGEETGKARNALKELGLDNKAFFDLNPGDRYIAVARAISEYADGAGKTALALDLFGKAGAAQIPTLNALGEAGDLTAKITKEQALQSQEYERNLRTLDIQLGSTKKVIAGEFIGALNDFVKALIEVITQTGGVRDEAKKLAADGSVKGWARDAATYAAYVVDALDEVGRVFSTAGRQIGAFAAAADALKSGDVLHGDFSGLRMAGNIIKEMNGDLRAISSRPRFSDTLKTQFAKSDVAAPREEKPQSKYQGTPSKGRAERLEDTSKAEYAVRKAALEAEAALTKQYNKEEEEDLDNQYKHNLVSIEDYYAQKTAIQQADIQSSIDAKKQEIDANTAAQGTAATDRERLNLKAEQIKLTGQLKVLEEEYSNVVIVNARAATEAERQRADALREVAIASTSAAGTAQVEKERTALDLRRQLRLTSDAQAIDEQKGFEDRLTAIQAQAIRDRLALEQAGTNDPAKIAALYAQLEQLDRDHQAKLTQLDAQATVEREKYATEAAARVQDTFGTFFDDLTDRSKKLSDVFKDLGKNLLKAFNDIQSKKMAEQLFGSGTSGGGVVSDLMKQLFPATTTPAKGTAAAASTTTGGLGGFFDALKGFFGGGAPAKPAATAEQNDVAGLAALDAAAMSTSNSMTALSTTGIGGMFKSTTDWIAKQFSGIAVATEQATTAQTATGALGALTSAAYGAATALQSVAASGGGSSGSSLMGEGTSLFGGEGEGMDALSGLFSGLATFADGTDYVPRDMIAMIHEGEKITPARFNQPAPMQAVGAIHQTINVPPSTSRASAAQIGMAVYASTAAAAQRYR